MEEESPVSMIDYLSEVSIFKWPSNAAYCTNFNGGAQFFSEDGEEVGYTPFFSLVFCTDEVLSKDDFLAAQLKQLTEMAESIRLELEEAQ